jgi:hypothetical protein
LSPTKTSTGLSWLHPDRQLPVVENGMLVGIVAQADIPLTETRKKTGELVEPNSEPSYGDRR